MATAAGKITAARFTTGIQVLVQPATRYEVELRAYVPRTDRHGVTVQAAAKTKTGHLVVTITGPGYSEPGYGETLYPSNHGPVMGFGHQTFIDYNQLTPASKEKNTL